MKYFLLVSLLTLFVSGNVVAANEMAQCFEKAWGHPDDGGLGLNRGQAVELCGGATAATDVAQCFDIAWGHPDDGGLGLNRGQAVDLCKKRY